jgi:NADPH-dependent 2,4-dienoyl-CoA reductase/sulfur reductase-like enzyme
MAAAASAAEQGRTVALVDDNFDAGGQIWRGENFVTGASTIARKWYRRMTGAGVDLLYGWRVFDFPQAGILRAESSSGDVVELQYGALILATGARERFLPFPGWTLPNVMGAGGLQAMVKNGLPIRSKKIVVAGTGPLLIAVAAYLKKHGALVQTICEQASMGNLLKFGSALLQQPGKIAQGLQYRWQTLGIPFATSCWPIAAIGNSQLRAVVLTDGKKQWEIACDYLACGYHLVPNIELAQLIGCEIDDGYVRVDALQRTSISQVFCAGEPTGIGGLERSLIEGEIAGLASAGNKARARSLYRVREKLYRFARALDTCFALRTELKDLPREDTLLCRCEDVVFGTVRAHTSWRAAKLHTRCGMGPCQGRICGPAAEFLLGWKTDSVRPPALPVRISSLGNSKLVGNITQDQETR